MVANSPYKTALQFAQPKPNWVPGALDADRVTAYWTYADIFHNIDTAFTAVLRDADGEEISRRYVPGARTIIEATNRYLAKNLTFVPEVPLDATVTPESQAATMATLLNLFKREEFGAKFLSLKRWMLIRGDALLQISADPLKPEGTRIRITEISPEHYFPIFDRIDAERVVGCYIVSVILNDDEDEIAQRIEYRRILTTEDQATYGVPIGSVYYKMGFYEIDGWDDRWPEFSEDDLKPVDTPSAFRDPTSQLALAGFAMPSQITAVPIYHMRNNRRGTAPFGTSEIQGIETLLTGLTQNLTDEDIAVALQGIGVFYTDSGRPRNDQGEEVEWEISPASIIELEDGKKLGRVEGGSVDSMQTHMNKLESTARETTGTSDVAVGIVDVKAAQSGIALAIQLMPTLAKNAEKEEELGSKLDQFLYDLLNGWLPAYEGLQATGLSVTAHFGDPIPVDRAAVVKEVADLVTAKIITVEFALGILKDKLGYALDPATMAAALQKQEQAALDATSARLDQAVNGAPSSATPPAA